MHVAHRRTLRLTPLLLSLAIALSLIPFFPGIASATPVEIYADPNGSGNVCSFSSPCSLEGARDKARNYNTTMTDDIMIYLKGGTYNLTSTFELVENGTTSDSGYNGHYIIYSPASGASPTISSEIDLSGGWTLHDAGKNIYVRNVTSSFDTRQLYVEGTRATRARTNTSLSTITANGTTGYTLPSSGTFSNMANWGNKDDIEFVGSWLYSMIRCSVDTIVGSAVTLDTPCRDLRPGTDLNWIENAYELINVEGEWYLDKAADKLYYKPRTGENMSTAEVSAPNIQTLLRGTGTNGDPLKCIIFSGIRFASSSWLAPNLDIGYVETQGGFYYNFSNPANQQGTGLDSEPVPGAVTFKYVNDITIEGNQFEKLGGNALTFELGSQNVLIEGNRFYDISGGGILVGGTALDTEYHHPTDADNNIANITIKNNYISYIGRDYYGSVGINVGVADTVAIKYNEIAYIPYSGISANWSFGRLDNGGTEGYTTDTYATDYEIAYNLIHDYMYPGFDGGGVYVNGNAPNSTIHDNYLYNSFNDFGQFYLDNGSSYWEVYNNVTRYGSGGTQNYGIFVQNNNFFSGCLSQNNNIHDNYFDTSNNQFYSAANTVGTNTTFSNTSIPTAAQNIIGGAGIQSTYRSIIPDITYGFDDWAGYGTGYSLDGIWSGIDFGVSKFLGDDSSTGLTQTNYAYFDNSTTTSDSFILPVGTILQSIVLEGSGTYSISDCTNTASGSLSGYGTPNTINTGWTSGGRTITLTFSNGWGVVFDNIKYGTP